MLRLGEDVFGGAGGTSCSGPLTLSIWEKISSVNRSVEDSLPERIVLMYALKPGLLYAEASSSDSPKSFVLGFSEEECS